MPAHPLKIVAGLFAAGLLACAPAHAAYGNVSASLDNIKFELIDLDLTDNISPSLTFTSTYAGGTLDSYSYAGGADEKAYSYGFESVNRKFTFGSGSLQNSATSMHADLHASPLPGDVSATVNARQYLNFTLSPSTRLLVTSQANVSIEQQGIGQQGTSQSNAIAILEGSVTSRINGVWGSESFFSQLERRTGSGSEFLRGSLDTGTGVGTGTLSLNIGTAFNYNASPVPEPETYGMLLAGLMVVGSVARRKRRA